MGTFIGSLVGMGLLLLLEKNNNIKHIIWTIFNFGSGTYMHIVVQQISRASTFYNTETLYPLNTNPFFPISLIATFLLFVSVFLITLDNSHEWNLTAFIFFVTGLFHFA